jgi:hypothetical protein
MYICINTRVENGLMYLYKVFQFKHVNASAGEWTLLMKT